MNQQDKNLATSDLLFVLKQLAELNGRLDISDDSVYTIKHKQKIEMSLDALKSAIQTINKGE